jgi:hypothetical protein
MTYAAFASHLGRNAFDAIYWLLFSTVIVMLFLSSWRYSTLVPTILAVVCSVYV